MKNSLLNKAIERFIGGSTNIEDIGFESGKIQKQNRRERQAWLEAFNRNSRLRTPIHCIAEDSSVVEWHVERMGKDGLAEKISKWQARGAEKALCDLMARPHPRLSWKAFSYLIIIYLELCGIAAIHMRVGSRGIKKGEQPTVLAPIAPHMIEECPSNTSSYWRIAFEEFDKDGKRTVLYQNIPQHQMLSIYRPRTTAPLSDWAGAAGSVDDEVSIDEAQSKWSLRTFLHGTFLGSIIALPNLQERREEIIKNWRAKYSGYTNAGKDYFVDSQDSDKVQVLPLSRSPIDMALSESRIVTRDMLGTAWQVPPERMGIIEDANRSTIDVADFHQQSKNVLPRLIEIREELNWRLAPKFGKNLRVAFENPVRESEENRVNRIETAMRIGLMQVDEGRDGLGMTQVGDQLGQSHTIPINNVALISPTGERMFAEVLEPTETTPTTPSTPTPKQEDEDENQDQES